MSEFGDRIDGLSRLNRNWQELMRAGVKGGAAHAGAAQTSLVEVTGFGGNPGQLRMLCFVPPDMARGAPLVVNLHGCLQNAAAYAAGTGWPELAERLGFALLCPEQQRGNNSHMCFNWFQPADVTRGEGEVESIRQMIEHIITTHALNRRRVFITGLSAGGAMTSAMLATYPELFAGGAIIAGLPYRSAGSVPEALETMMHGRARPEQDWAALVRAANPQARRWPPISVWHGMGDTTVAPANAAETVKQWRAVQDLPEAPARQDVVDGARHSVWRDARGTDMLEEYLVPGLGHGTPIDAHPRDDARRCGKLSPYVLDGKIPSTLHIARFWGLLPKDAAAVKSRPAKAWPPVLEDVLSAAGRVIDPKQVIERALRAAGLMKGGK